MRKNHNKFFGILLLAVIVPATLTSCAKWAEDRSRDRWKRILLNSEYLMSCRINGADYYSWNGLQGHFRVGYYFREGNRPDWRLSLYGTLAHPSRKNPSDFLNPGFEIMYAQFTMLFGKGDSLQQGVKYYFDCPEDEKWGGMKAYLDSYDPEYTYCFLVMKKDRELYGRRQKGSYYPISGYVQFDTVERDTNSVINNLCGHFCAELKGITNGDILEIEEGVINGYDDIPERYRENTYATDSVMTKSGLGLCLII